MNRLGIFIHTSFSRVKEDVIKNSSNTRSVAYMGGNSFTNSLNDVFIFCETGTKHRIKICSHSYKICFSLCLNKTDWIGIIEREIEDILE